MPPFRSQLLFLFILLSLLLHLLLLWLTPPPQSDPIPDEAPVYVEVQPPPPAERPREFIPPQPETPRDRPAKRLGARDHQVEKEETPQGESTESTAPPPTPQPSPRPAEVATTPPETSDIPPAEERPETVIEETEAPATPPPLTGS